MEPPVPLPFKLEPKAPTIAPGRIKTKFDTTEPPNANVNGNGTTNAKVNANGNLSGNGTGTGKSQASLALPSPRRREISFMEMMDLGPEGIPSSEDDEIGMTKGEGGPPLEVSEAQVFRRKSHASHASTSTGTSTETKREMSFLEFLDMEDDELSSEEEEEYGHQRSSSKSTATAIRTLNEPAPKKELKKELTFLEFLDMDSGDDSSPQPNPSQQNQHLQQIQQRTARSISDKQLTWSLDPALMARRRGRLANETKNKALLEFSKRNQGAAPSQVAKPSLKKIGGNQKRQSLLEALDLEKTGYVFADELSEDDDEAADQAPQALRRPPQERFNKYTYAFGLRKTSENQGEQRTGFLFFLRSIFFFFSIIFFLFFFFLLCV